MGGFAVSTDAAAGGGCGCFEEALGSGGGLGVSVTLVEAELLPGAAPWRLLGRGGIFTCVCVCVCAKPEW